MLNRILGILVVLAIGVLAYPFAFNPHDSFAGSSESIPAPTFPSAQNQSSTIEALNINDKLSNKVSLKQKIHTSKLNIDDNKKNKHNKLSIKNMAWVIQVGSYRDKTNALRLANQLRAKGYNAFIQQRNAALGEEIQVFVGPENKKDTAVLTANKLSKETKLSGVVKMYKLLSA